MNAIRWILLVGVIAALAAWIPYGGWNPLLWNFRYQLSKWQVDGIEVVPVLIGDTVVGAKYRATLQLKKGLSRSESGREAAQLLNFGTPQHDGAHSVFGYTAQQILYYNGKEVQPLFWQRYSPDATPPAGEYVVARTSYFYGIQPHGADKRDLCLIPVSSDMQARLKQADKTPLKAELSARGSWGLLGVFEGYDLYTKSQPVDFKYDHTDWILKHDSLPLPPCPPAPAATTGAATGPAPFLITTVNIKKAEQQFLFIDTIEPVAKGANVVVYAATTQAVSNFMSELMKSGAQNVQLREVRAITACNKNLQRAIVFVPGDSSNLAPPGKFSETSITMAMVEQPFICTIKNKEPASE